MYGAIIGDLAGSIYEYDQIKNVKNIKIKNLIEEKAFYSDDTILTIAILEAILNDRNYEKYLKHYIKEYSNYKPNFTPYFKTTFSPNLMKWATNESLGRSVGNGAMMRISPVGHMFDDELSVIENARLATIPSHNTYESIDCATKISLIIFYLRKGLTKDEIFKKLDIKLKYTPFTKFNYTCSETIDNLLYVFYNSNSFDDAIKKAIYLGGDTDTNACIVGSLAEVAYGIDNDLIELANKKIPEKFVKILSRTKLKK